MLGERQHVVVGRRIPTQVPLNPTPFVDVLEAPWHVVQRSASPLGKLFFPREAIGALTDLYL